MVAATYTSDLTDIFLFESTSGVGAYGGGGAGLGAGPDYAIEGTNAVDKQVSASEKGFMYDNGANFTIGADDHFFIWLVLGVYGLADTRDNRGIHVSIGDDTSNFVKFHVNGSDTLPAGGIKPYAIRFDNTALANRRTLVGTPGTTPSQIGGGANVTGTARFANFACDAARIGTGYDILNGTGADPEANFAGVAADDESTSEGVFQTADGGFKLQGKLRIGSASTACEFLDSNTNVFIIDTLDGESLSDFTEILVENASSILTLTNVNFIALGTHNKGRFEALTSAASIPLNNVGFIGFGETVLGTGSVFTGCRWIGADIVTANGATLTGSTISGFEGASDTSPLIWDVATDPNGKLDGMSFTKGTASTHAIEFGTTSLTTMTLTDIDFADYNTLNGQTDSVLHIKRTAGTVDITISGGSGTVSYKSDGATVNIISGAVTVQALASLKDGTPVENARVFLKASDGTGPFPFEDSVTITRSGTTATVAHTAHGMATNDKVTLVGITDKVEDNGTVFQITVTGANSYTYATTNSGSTNYTGTITSTFVALNGLTNASGILSTSRVYPSAQPVVGWTRKSSASPYLQEGVLVGEVSSSTGFSGTAVMLADE